MMNGRRTIRVALAALLVPIAAIPALRSPAPSGRAEVRPRLDCAEPAGGSGTRDGGSAPPIDCPTEEASQADVFSGVVPVPQEDYRAHDRDWCSVNDFWSAEGQGIYSLADVGEGTGEVRLIELAIITADEPEESPD